MVNRFSALLVAVVLSFASAYALAQDGTVPASVDRTAITLDSAVQLTIELPAEAAGQVGVPEGGDFSVISHASSSQIEIRNGRRSTRTTITLMLRPVREGELTIGRVPVQMRNGVRYTEPIAVNVARHAAPTPQASPTAPTRPVQRVAPPPSPQGVRAAPLSPLSDGLFFGPIPEVRGDEAFVLATLTSDAAVVGQQVVVDYVLFTPSRAFRASAVDLTEPEFTSMWFMDITDWRMPGVRSRLGSRRIGGAVYDATLIRSYALFPLNDGRIVIPGLSVAVEIGGMRVRDRQNVMSTPLELNVTELPASGQPPGFLDENVGEFVVNAATDKMNARVGDPVNLSLTVSGTGLMTRITLPEITAIDGARVYAADDDSVQDVGPDLWLRGTARRDVTFVPQREGILTIPPISFDFFNPWTDAYEQVQTPELSIDVAGVNPNVQQPAADEEPIDVDANWLAELPAERPVSSSVRPTFSAANPIYWSALTLPVVAYFGWLVLGATQRKRAQKAPARARASAGSKALKALVDADPAEVAQVLRRYLTATLETPISGLTHDALQQMLATRVGEDDAVLIAETIQRADAARYGGGEEIGALRDAARDAVERVEASR